MQGDGTQPSGCRSSSERSERPDLFAQRTHSKLLFARKHLSRVSRVAFYAALTLRHALRTAVCPSRSRRAGDRPGPAWTFLVSVGDFGD